MMTIEEDIFKSLPTNREVFDEYYGTNLGPVGIHLEPAIAGFPNNAPEFDEAAFLARPPLSEDFDATKLRGSKVTVIKSAGHTAVSGL
jgi:hypothetical protein